MRLGCLHFYAVPPHYPFVTADLRDFTCCVLDLFFLKVLTGGFASSLMERKVSASQPEQHLPLLTEGRGASLGYRGHKDEQTF